MTEGLVTNLMTAFLLCDDKVTDGKIEREFNPGRLIGAFILAALGFGVPFLIFWIKNGKTL